MRFPVFPIEARWKCPAPRRILSPEVLARITHSAFPRQHVTDVQPFADGLRNANFKIRLSSASDPVVFRIYEHDPSLCQKEIDLFRLLSGSVPVPEIIHAEPLGLEEVPPFTVARYVEGVTFLALKRSGDRNAIAQAAFSAGEVLAGVGRIAFAKPGWLGPGPAVTAPFSKGGNVLPHFIDLCFASVNLQRRIPTDLRHRAHNFIRSWAAQLAQVKPGTQLVHGDFSRRNLMVRCIAGRWRVAAVLDWEFAVSGSPLADLGSFLRYESAAEPLAEPHFSTGYLHNGGALPVNWRTLARLFDFAALCESLTHDGLPNDVIAELVELVRVAMEVCDPPWS